MSRPSNFLTQPSAFRSVLSSQADPRQAEANLTTTRLDLSVLNAPAQAACYAGLKVKLMELLADPEIKGDEARRGRHTLETTTAPYARLETWHDNLRALIGRRQRNKLGLRGTLAPACPTCGQAAGYNYAICPACYEASGQPQAA